MKSAHWVDEMMAELEAAPTVAKGLAVLLAAIAKAKGDVTDIMHHGNKIAAAMIKGTAAEDEPLT